MAFPLHAPLRTAAFAAVLLAVALPSIAAAQPRCEAPRVLLTVDKSSSMLDSLPSGESKWTAARTAIETVTMAFADRIDFGLQPFPFPDRCEPGRVTLDVGPNDAATISSMLGAPPPEGGNWTPMAQTIDAILSYAPMMDATRSNHVILVTDGWQWCSPYDAATRFDPVDAVSRLADAGVTVHIVGFGAAVDALTLNRAAVAAGTSLPGCDPTLDDPAAMGHCYTQANDMVALRDALRAIARDVTDELCDGFDNDCDGTIDEGFDVDGDGVKTCDGDCNDRDARVRPGLTEFCDDVDNDCDGMIDTGCDCTAGDNRPCGSDVGACMPGLQACVGGTWSECTGGTTPTEELCDGLDGDCDGTVDEAVDCGPDFACIDGGCVNIYDPPEEPAMPPGDDGPRITPPLDPGCGCQAAGADTLDRSVFAPVAGLLLLGVAGLLVGRRRKRR